MKGSATPVPNVELKSTPEALGYSLINWLVPGLGFILVGDRFRGLLLFFVINGIFGLGIFFDGYVYLPSFKLGPEFNIVSILTFIVQGAHGLGAGLLLLLSGGENFLSNIFVRSPGAPYSDLGSFHLLVAGGLNYFASVRLFDLLTGYEEPKSTKEKAVSEKSETPEDSRKNDPTSMEATN
ncbi:MAG: DUF6677 family protein [Sumerlaeia bacterium]